MQCGKFVHVKTMLLTLDNAIVLLTNTLKIGILEYGFDAVLISFWDRTPDITAF
jgi:hypothetical protein